ncbi:MAG: hypothetical protein NW224_06560 [Leptolyngbyaceae cyanobacterium bins.302]|nr:hypothetical protein [Leptolyngbyaceae cyanobacterium bins.302]
MHIVSDGSLTVADLQNALTWWAGEKSFSHWKDVVDYHHQHGREALVQFANNSILGRKFAAILQFAEQGATLWCDTDILWFKELKSLPVFDSNSKTPVLKIAEDYQESYDQNLINHSLEHLHTPPYFNTGLVFLQGNLLQACDVEGLLSLAAKTSNHFTEQTLLAVAFSRLGQDYWSKEEIACFETDKLSLAPTYLGRSWTARHYVGPVRYSFWRDALVLRVFSSNNSAS